jgi:hypothetical protein
MRKELERMLIAGAMLSIFASGVAFAQDQKPDDQKQKDRKVVVAPSKKPRADNSNNSNDSNSQQQSEKKHDKDKKDKPQS